MVTELSSAIRICSVATFAVVTFPNTIPPAPAPLWFRIHDSPVIFLFHWMCTPCVEIAAPERTCRANKFAGPLAVKFPVVTTPAVVRPPPPTVTGPEGLVNVNGATSLFEIEKKLFAVTRNS